MWILVFGDSIAYGAWSFDGGWVQRLRTFIEKKFGKDGMVYNLSISGEITADLLKRFDSETKVRTRKNMMIIFQIGLNDSQIMCQNQKPRVPIEQFKTNFQDLIRKAKAITEKVAVIGLTPVDKRVNPLPWDSSRAHIIENTIKFDSEIQSICRTEKTLFVPVLEELNSPEFLFDGVHLTDKGHDLIFEKLRTALVREKLV